MIIRRTIGGLLATLLALAGLTLVASPASAATFTENVTGDTYVTTTNATANFSTALTMKANGTPEKIALMTFDVDQIPAGATNISATLTVHGTDVAQTTQTITLVRVDPFDPTTVTYNTRPATIATVGTDTLARNTNASFSPAISANGLKYYGITAAGTTGTDTVEMDTSEVTTSTLRPKLVITYTPAVTNTAPVVNAGPNQTINPVDTANLDGTVTDDGNPNPPAAVTKTWSKVSGPGTVTFGNTAAVDTTATFSASGTYVLRLTANDSALSDSDDVQITVRTAPYGSDGSGSTASGGCTTTVGSGSDVNTAIGAATAGDVVCVSASSRTGTTITLNKAITLRATGVVSIKNAAVSAGGTLDGFTVVGGTAGNPATGISFTGNNNTITNNLINGHGLEYGIRCTTCNSGTVVSHNTITEINNYGIFITNGSSITIEWNDIYDLYESVGNGMDVDAMRPFGTNHIVRNNYMHDLNVQRSYDDPVTGLPHLDCIQHYQSGTTLVSDGLLVENNYCVRVSGMFIISKNDRNTTTSMENMKIRGNVAETYGTQVIILSGVPNAVIENNSLFGATSTGPVIALEHGDSGAQATNVDIQNNVLVRGVTGNPAIGNKAGGSVTAGIIDVNRDNENWVDTDLATRDANWVANPSQAANAPATVWADFTDYLTWEQESPNSLLNQGSTLLTTGFTTDIAGDTRVQSSVVDIGAYELG